MPTQATQNERPELGYTGVGQYLDANQGTLAAGLGQARSDAAPMTGSFDAMNSAAEALGKSTGTAPQPSSVEGYQGALDQATKAQDLSRQTSSESALAGSGRLGQGPYGAFNATLGYAAHGPQYQQLSEYLGGYSPSSLDAGMTAAGAKGAGEYVAPKPPAPPAPPAAPPTGEEQPLNEVPVGVNASGGETQASDQQPDQGGHSEEYYRRRNEAG